VTDALGQISTFFYDHADTPISITYGNAVHSTSPVSFTLDPAFLRVLTMTDGTGKTTYTYNPVTSPPALGAGLLNSVTGPGGDTVGYVYDQLDRTTKATIDGAVSQYTYDAMGRIASHQDPLDTFNFSYFGATGFPLSIHSGNGLSSLYSYYGVTGDERLKSITNNSHAGGLISAFQYALNAGGLVTATTIQKQFATTVTRTNSYDAANRLIGVMAAAGGGNNYVFAYDPAGNLTSEKRGAVTKSFTYNNVNALTAPTPASYDKDGQPLMLGSATYQWDAAHRLIAVTSSTNTTKFAYDARGHRTRITQLSGSTVVGDKFYFWCGTTNPCVERDALNSNVITKRYFSEGVLIGGQSFYYAADFQGSVRELVNSLGAVDASYDYDAYGVRTKLLASEDSDFGFAGLFHETRSGLDLAVFRPYAAAMGRWLNRDPIGERSGLNLYTYASNNPTTLIDPRGLWTIAFGGDSAVAGYFGGGGSIGAGSGVVCGTDGCWHIVCRAYSTANGSAGIGAGGGAGAGFTGYVSPFGDVNTFNGTANGVSGDAEVGPIKGSLGVSAPKGDLTSLGISFTINGGPPSAEVSANFTHSETVESKNLFSIGIGFPRTPWSILNEDRKKRARDLENSFPQDQTPALN
jgi:RHS repeat-associated protein